MLTFYVIASTKTIYLDWTYSDHPRLLLVGLSGQHCASPELNHAPNVQLYISVVFADWSNDPNVLKFMNSQAFMKRTERSYIP